MVTPDDHVLNTDGKANWALVCLRVPGDRRNVTRLALRPGGSPDHAAEIVELAPGDVATRLVRLSGHRLHVTPLNGSEAADLRYRQLGPWEAWFRLVMQTLGRPGRLLIRLRTTAGLTLRGDLAEIRRRAIALGGGVNGEVSATSLAPPSRPITGRRSTPAAAIRVAAFTPSLDLEGAPISQLQLMAGLHARGVIDPVIIAGGDGPLRARYDAAGIPVEILERTSQIFRSTHSLNRWQKNAARLLSMHHIEAVHANTVGMFPAIETAHLMGLPSVWNIRESGTRHSGIDGLPHDIRARAMKSLSRATRTVFVSQASATVWTSLAEVSAPSVIVNALPDDRRPVEPFSRSAAPGLTADEVFIVCPGTVCERKGQIDIVIALEQLAELPGPRIAAWFLGNRDEAYARRLDERVSRMGRTDRVRILFTGAMEAPQPVIAAADIVAITSREESYPRVVLEAMAAGRAIVTTPVFGISEQVDSRSALFYAPGQAEMLAKHITRLAADRRERERLGSAARERFEALPGFGEMLDAYGREFAACFENR